ncbi:MAG: hypothetical protein GXP54_13140 [Deltaproteobacteria bacterium]|nr:hypothetical protein [Deltaproteobacteria bacterium]
MSRKLPVIFYTCCSGIEGTGSVRPLDTDQAGAPTGAVTVCIQSIVPDCRGLDPDVSRAEWYIEVGNRVREGAMPLVQTGTVATFNLNDVIAGGMASGETGVILSLSIRGLDQQGNERVTAQGSTLIREQGVYMAAVPDPDNPGRERDLLDDPDMFALHDGILLYRAEPRHMRHRPFPYFVFSVRMD